MADPTYRIRGIAPPDLPRDPATRRLFYGWVVEIGLRVKDRELARGLDRHGEPLRAISPKTRRYRRSAMTPTGKGDPSAPPLMPARALSRTRSLLAGRPTEDAAVFYWRFDPSSGRSWGDILLIQKKKYGRDVFGISPKGVARVKALAWERWRRHKAGEAPPPATTRSASPGIPQVGSYSTAHATFGIGAAGPPAFLPGRSTGGMTWPEWRKYFTQTNPAPVAIPGRPAAAYPRISAFTWGQSGGPTPLRGPAGGAMAPARPSPGERPGPRRPPARPPAAAAGTPMGIPLSRVLEAPKGRFGDRLRSALAAVDRVHGDGRLSRIPIEPYDEPDGYLGMFEALGEEGKARPHRIRSFTGAPRAELNLVHELGHYIEGFAIPGHRKLARDWDGDPTLAAWKQAVGSSKAFKALESLIGQDIVAAEGKRVRVDQDNVKYLLRWDELWARSYAQYIAVRSQDPTLLHQVDQARDRGLSAIYFHRQWDDADFGPIAEAIDQLFRGLKWRA